MARTTLALLLALGAASARAQGIRPPPNAGPPGSPPAVVRPPETLPPKPAASAEPRAAAPLPRGAVLEEVAGVVRDVDRKAQKFSVEAGGERVTLSLDRNTMVYTPAGLGTVLDVVPGAQIRAGRNADFLAYWVQVRAPAAEPPPTPDQGTGPGGGAAAPTIERGDPGKPSPGAKGTSPATSPSAGDTH